MTFSIGDPDKSKSVLVTGASGYVAGWIVKMLLDEGLIVHAAVRDPHNQAKVAHLVEMARENPKALKLFSADLMTPGSYDEAMKGCGIVFHTASPFTLANTDPQKMFVEPALEGTRNVLNSVNGTNSVTRVVLTSSSAAIYSDAIDCAEAKGGVLTEENWNTSSSLTHNAYSFSKTLAEREAWKMNEAQNRWRLVVINPTLIIGQGLGPVTASGTFEIAAQIGKGVMRMGAPEAGVGAVDVRDVALAHIRAAFKDDAEGWHILSAENTNLLELAKLLSDTFPQYPLPTRAAPKWLLMLVGPLSGISRDWVRRNVNIPINLDNSKSVAALGISYRPIKAAFEETFQMAIDAGMFKKRS